MLKNKKFAGFTVAFSIIAILMMFFYSGLQNDHLNVLSVVLANNYGWSSTQIYLGNNIGSYIAIILYLLCGVGFIRLGIKKLMVPTTFILGIATILLGVVGSAEAPNFVLYTILLCIVRCGVVPLQMGAFMMCANWYIKYRGRMMGVITIGSPFFSVVGINLLSALCANGIRTGYLLFGGIVVVMAIAMMIFLKDKPSDMGLYADGSDTPPKSETDDIVEDMTLKQVLGESRAWKLIVSYGILQAVIAAMMGTMALRYVMAGEGFGAGTRPMLYLSIGALLGIPMSYILGWIDDKLGSIKASIVLNLLYFFAVLPFLFMPWDMTSGTSPVVMLIWAFGVACMTGGCPTMHPSITSYVYGRKHYQAANKWIMTIQAILMATALPIMNVLFDMSMPGETHGPNGIYAQAGYIGLTILLVVSLIVIISMRNIPDANLADRDYADKK